MRFIATLLASLCLAATGFAQTIIRYELVEPTGRVTATAEVLSGRLVVHESNRQRIYFSRESRYDSSDGRLVGYLHQESGRVLRIPRSGAGLMEMASLNDVSPRFIPTRRSIRPRGPIGSATIANHYRGESYGLSPYGYDDQYSSGYRPRKRPRQPQSILLDSQTVPNAPLPPATLQLANSGPRELRVTVVDLKNPNGKRQLRIAPRQLAEVKLQRDTGSQLVQNFRTYTPYGEPVTREVVTPVPPQVRYEIVVHEWAMQSIAIDRTGKSPAVIEDINFQGRGLGRFPLPPGPQLQSGRIDVYAVSKQAGNAGTVAPIVPADNQGTGSQGVGNASKLEQAIFDAQRRAGN